MAEKNRAKNRAEQNRTEQRCFLGIEKEDPLGQTLLGLTV